MIATVVQEGRVATAWVQQHADGLDEVLPLFRSLDIAAYSHISEQARCAS